MAQATGTAPTGGRSKSEKREGFRLFADAIIILAVLGVILYLVVSRSDKTEYLEITVNGATAVANLTTGEVEVADEAAVSWPLVRETYNQLENRGIPGKWQSLADDTQVPLDQLKRAVDWEVSAHQQRGRSYFAVAETDLAIYNTWPDQSRDSASYGYRRFGDILETGTPYLRWSHENPYIRDDLDYWESGWGVKGFCLNSMTPRHGATSDRASAKVTPGTPSETTEPEEPQEDRDEPCPVRDSDPNGGFTPFHPNNPTGVDPVSPGPTEGAPPAEVPEDIIEYPDEDTGYPGDGSGGATPPGEDAGPGGTVPADPPTDPPDNNPPPADGTTSTPLPPG